MMLFFRFSVFYGTVGLALCLLFYSVRINAIFQGRYSLVFASGLYAISIISIISPKKMGVGYLSDLALTARKAA